MTKKGELDVMIGTGKFDSGLFRTESLAPERLYLAMPEKFCDGRFPRGAELSADDIINGTLKSILAEPVPLEKIADLPFVISKHGEFGHDIIEKICEKYNFTPKISLNVLTLETVFSMVSAGLGVSLIPDTLIRFGDHRSHPVYYPLKPDYVSQTIYLVSRMNGYFSNAARQYSVILKRLVDIGTWK